MRGERPRPGYPIAALYRAGLWELSGHSGKIPTAHGDHELKRWFADTQPHGGLAEPAYELLKRSGEARLTVIDSLLCRYFQDLDYSPLLADTGLFDDGMAEDLDADGDARLHPVIRAARYSKSITWTPRPRWA